METIKAIVSILIIGDIYECLVILAACIGDFDLVRNFSGRLGALVSCCWGGSASLSGVAHQQHLTVGSGVAYFQVFLSIDEMERNR